MPTPQHLQSQEPRFLYLVVSGSYGRMEEGVYRRWSKDTGPVDLTKREAFDLGAQVVPYTGQDDPQPAPAPAPAPKKQFDPLPAPPKAVAGAGGTVQRPSVVVPPITARPIGPTKPAATPRQRARESGGDALDPGMPVVEPVATVGDGDGE